MDTPVPISNTEVKHFYADDSVCKNRESPIFFCLLIDELSIFLYANLLNLLHILVIIKLVIEMEYKYTSKNEMDTIELAQNFESEKFPNMIICLDGELGSGKTVFTKGIANALGVKESITSPTFTIVKEYDGELPLYHMDVYRLDGSIDGTGIEEYFTKGGVVVIEWANTIKEYLPEERLDIKFKVIDEDKRVLILRPHGVKYEELCEAVL